VNAGLLFNAFAFGDAGRVASIAPLPEEDRSRDLRSYGAGLSFQMRGGISGVIMWAHPLIDGNRTKAGDDRLHFSLRSAW
jgi:hemolysin activation/secretion protein